MTTLEEVFLKIGSGQDKLIGEKQFVSSKKLDLDVQNSDGLNDKVEPLLLKQEIELGNAAQLNDNDNDNDNDSNIGPQLQSEIQSHSEISKNNNLNNSNKKAQTQTQIQTGKDVQSKKKEMAQMFEQPTFALTKNRGCIHEIWVRVI